MTHKHVVELRRASIGIVVALCVILLAFASARASTTGPQWGLRLETSPDGGVAIGDVNVISPVHGYVQRGDRVVSLDGNDPLPLVSDDLSSVHEIAYLSSVGEPLSVRIDSPSRFNLASMTVAGLLFVLLGSLVYRWCADALVGRLFLSLSGSFATALVSMPAAQVGEHWASLLVPSAALLAAPSLAGLFLIFPRRVRFARPIITVSLGIALTLAGSQVLATLTDNTSPVLDTLCSLWMLTMMLGAVVLLARHASSPSARRVLAPLLIGTGVGVAPAALLFGLRMLLKVSLPLEILMLPMAAIPLGFAYSILHHQTFGLDALVRRGVLRIAVISLGVATFFLVDWAAGLIGLDVTESALIASILAAILTRPLARHAAAIIDRWLYPPFYRLIRTSERLDGDSPAALGTAAAVRVRELVPTAWAACLVLEDAEAAHAEAYRELGSDGQRPDRLAHSISARDIPADAVVVPVRRAARTVGVLLIGPRLDGSRLNGLEHEIVEALARSIAAPLDAALLRERAEEEVRFRQGVTRLTHDLAGSATVLDVLRSTAVHVATLLKANAVSVMRCAATGSLAVIDGVSAEHAATAELLSMQQSPTTPAWTALDDSGRVLAFNVGLDSTEPDVCVVTRADHEPRFTSRDVRRAAEIAEHVYVAVRRAAEREQLEDQLRHQAFYDSLTGLPNRALFADRLEHSQARAARFSEQLAVLFIDLDRFKVINDSLGHAAGDQLLIQAAARLRACVRASDTIARLGGDEFTVLLEGPRARDEAINAADRILTALREQFSIDDQDVYVSASIGVAGVADGLEPGRDLMREADIALYRAKEAGRACYMIYEDRMSRMPTAHLHLESELHRALERGELRVHYQPIFALSDGRINALEALVRWEHPTKGLVSPGEFVPLAEDTGLIVPIGKWVLEQACSSMRQWHAEYPEIAPMKVSVNLSARQFQDAQLLTHVEQALLQAQLDPKYLQLEITESTVMHDAEGTIAKLHGLKALGIQLAMDDFGTGYSSLAYLKRFPIDVLKVDRSFVSGLIGGQHDLAIVQNVIGLAKALGLTTTAEGIEERSQWMILKQLGCENGQGFIYSGPLKPVEVVDLLDEETALMQSRAA